MNRLLAPRVDFKRSPLILRLGLHGADNGRRITPEFLPRVFDRSMQVHDQGDGYQMGLGIGLALVTMLVELHCGGVTAGGCGLGTGAEFIVRWPTVASPS